MLLLTLLLSCEPAKVQTSADDTGQAGTTASSATGASIAGRVCSADGWYWQEGATVYTHVKEDDRVLETRQAQTDAGGWYLLADLPPDHVYDVFIQLGAERLMDQEVYAIPLSEGQAYVVDEPDCDVLDPMDSLVVRGDYDDADGVLRPFGFPVTEVDGRDATAAGAALSDADLLGAYQLVIVESGIAEGGVLRGDGDTPGQVLAAVQAFVAGGGTLWVTDWSYDLVALAFPGALSFVGDDGQADSAQLGRAAPVSAALPDATLAAEAGYDYLDLAYNRSEFAVADGQAAGGTVVLQGHVTYDKDGVQSELAAAPLLVAFPHGEGRVLFSTFTLEENDGPEALALYRALLSTP